MSNFRERLEQAAQRGRRAGAERVLAEAAEALSEEEAKRLHSKYRLALTDHIEECLAQLSDSFPGFRYEAIVSEKGWGGVVTRDDLTLNRGKRENVFSRFAMTVSPHNKYGVLELIAKGTIGNKEIFSRNHYRLLGDVEIDEFSELVERWAIDYAEEYAANGP